MLWYWSSSERTSPSGLRQSGSSRPVHVPVAGEPAGRPSAITRGSTYVRSRSKPSAEYRLWPCDTTPRNNLSGGPVIVSVPSTIAAIVGADSNSVQLLVDVRAPGSSRFEMALSMPRL